MFKDFLLDESGAVTVDYTVFLGGVVWMGLTVVGDVSAAMMYLSERTEGQMSYEHIYEQVYGVTETSGPLPGPDAGGSGESDDPGDSGDSSESGDSGGSGSSGDSGSSGGSDGSSGSDDSGSSGSGAGNPGNDKNVGKSGENPNGKGGWGRGDRGKSR